MLNAKCVVAAAKGWWELHPERLELLSGNLIPCSGGKWNLSLFFFFFLYAYIVFTLRVPTVYVIVSLQKPSQRALTGSSELS